MIDFFKNYPLRYYSQRFLNRRPAADVALYLRAGGKVNASIRPQGGPCAYFPDAQKRSGAPVPCNPADPESPFRTHFLAHHGVPTGGRFSFILESPEIELRLISVDSLNFQTSEELRATSIKLLLPAFEQCERFVWEFFTPDFAPLGKELPTALLLVGVPKQIRDWMERWSEEMGGEVAHIDPAPLAILRWCRKHAGNFLLLPGTQQSLLAIFRDGNLLLLERQPGFSILFQSPGKFAGRINEFGRDLGIEDLSLSIYPGEIPPIKMREFAGRLGLVTKIIDASTFQKEIEGAPASLESGLMQECLERNSSLFVSDAHGRILLYRHHRLYQGTFAVLIIAGIIQIVAAGLYCYQATVSRKLTVSARNIKAETSKITAQETALAPLIRRIQSIAEWRQVIAQRQRISGILACIESAVPPEICLQSISIINTAREPKALDRLQLTITGWSKKGTDINEAFVKRLQSTLPNFSVALTPEASASHSGQPSTFSVEISQ